MKTRIDGTMRKKAKKILFETLKHQGAEELLFSSGKLSDESGLIETVVDAMVEFKDLATGDKKRFVEVRVKELEGLKKYARDQFTMGLIEAQIKYWKEV